MTATSTPTLPAELVADVEVAGTVDVVPRILDVVCQTTGMGFAAIARVTDAHWVTCAARDDIGFGLRPGDELDVTSTLCYEVRCDSRAIVIDDVDADDHYRSHETPARYGFKSYISVPIYLTDGSFYGTLCAIDPEPRSLTKSAALETLRLLAELFARHLEDRQRLAESQQTLASEREVARLRELFVAILGHDLRNPLNAIQMNSQLLEMLDGDADAAERQEAIASIRSSADRMTALINDTLDLARTRTDSGLNLAMDRVAPDDLIQRFRHVIDELRAGHTNRNVDVTLDLHRPVACNADRLGQVVSNLLANALTHGDPAAPVTVVARQPDDAALLLSVSNTGPPIPADVVATLFEPFQRGRLQHDTTRSGLGLGLFIAHEIALAHNGTLTCTSDDDATTFTLRIASPA